jgi:ribose/xylose/arabinose/galactoside ABC-type transport system permease subunit
MLAFLGAAGGFMRYTSYGQQIYSLGANDEAAPLSAVPARARLSLMYLLRGAMAGLSAIICVTCRPPLVTGISVPLSVWIDIIMRRRIEAPA